MKKIKIIINKLLISRRKKSIINKDISTINNKLYVLVSNKLNPIYGAVQGGHAIAQFLLEHPDSEWQNHTVVYLSCDIEHMKRKIQNMFTGEFNCKEISFFYEPDLGNELTAIAVYKIPQKYVRRLKLLK